MDTLGIAHIDCDAFYAAIEKRDDPSLADKPVIVGGGKRGVVSTCCYIARTFGVRSAMPMFKALKACPDAVVIKPDMAKYVAVSREVMRMMEETTPAVQALSLDEAFLDLTGTERLHRRSPAVTLADLARRIEREVGITVSVGLSYNKFLAKFSSEFDKPRGFAVLGHGDARTVLADRSPTVIFGVGKTFAAKLEADGITRLGQIQQMEETELLKRYGAMGGHVWRLARGEDSRRVDPDSEHVGMSAETTFENDIADVNELDRILWPLCEKVSARAKKAGTGGATIQLKLRAADFHILTGRSTLRGPTQLAETIFRTAHKLLLATADGKARYRLIGVGLSNLAAAEICDLFDLFEEEERKIVATPRRATRLDAAAARRRDTVRGPRQHRPHADRSLPRRLPRL